MPKKNISQTATSVLYRLLNELIRYNESTDAYGKICDNGDLYDKARIKDFDEEQKQQVRTNVLSAIIDVAAYLKDDKVIDVDFSLKKLINK